MPSTDGGLIPDFDDLDPPPAISTTPAHDTEPEEWPPTIPTKKSKKSKKSKKNAAAQLKVPEDDDDSPYAKSITPSPPNQQGVILPTTSPASPPQHTISGSPLHQVELSLDNDDTAVEEPEPPPKPLPAASPLSRSPQIPQMVSPRPRPAKLVSPAASPPVRPALINDTPQQSGLRRPSRTSLLAAQPRRDIPAPTTSSKSNFVDAPPPHMPQSHFFGLPDLGLELRAEQELGKVAGTDGYCCSFDSFSNCGDTASAKKAKDALLVGFDGGLDVYRVLPDKLEVVGRLEGLRGAVIKARLLPQTARFDDFSPSRPLVVVEIHGPLADDRNDSGRDDENGREPPARYQTTVEVYSLHTQTAVCTLYKSLPVELAKPAAGLLPLLPAPVGDLSIEAQGNFITITSGKSGEIFVFTNAHRINSPEASFRCIGKYWTSIQTRQDPPRAPASSTGISSVTDRRPREPLYSLSHRWLAIVPPYVSPGTSIQGWPLLGSDGMVPPGLSTHAPPNQPPVTCEIGGVDAEGTLGWLSRKAAQSLVKASQRGYDIGLQGWKELTQPSPAAGPNRPSSRDHEAFPPTNAPNEDPQRLAKEPALVSIIDLQRLLDAEESAARLLPQPLATLALVDGCNHLSFSPEGLRLLTSNRKGEVSNVWDLRNVAHGINKTSTNDGAAEHGPHVRQLNRFPRSSPSVVLDSIWSIDGHWLALLTAHGTIHLHQISDSAPTRRRKRRNTTSTSSADKADPTIGMTQGLSPPSSNGIWQSVRTGWQSVSTQVGTIRSQGTGIPTTFAGFREVTAAAGSAGTRAVARGLSQGFSAAKGGASDIWHADDNKIRHKSLTDAAAGSVSIRWIQKRSETLLGVVYGGNVHLHPVQQVTRRKGDEDVVGLKKYPARTFTLPRISTTHDNKPSACTQQGPHGFWILQNAMSADGRFARRRPSKLAATQIADVETNPPYCPFHIDSRVSIYAFDEHPSQVYSGSVTPWHLQGHGQDNNEPWCFGGPLPPSSRMNESAIVEDDTNFLIDDADAMQNIADQMRSQLIVRPNDQGVEQINVNTRRTAGIDEERFDDVAFDDA